MSATPESTFTNPEQRITDLERQLAECKAELAECKAEQDEALQRETATAEVLGVINSWPGDLTPVFDAMLEKALHLCGASFGSLQTYHADYFECVAAKGDPGFAERARSVGRLPMSRGVTQQRIADGARIVHLVDILEDPVYRAGNPSMQASVEQAGIRTLLTIALRKDDEVLGQISIYRREVQPFTDKQIALLQNFAAQAVIAMENARLLNELQDRTHDLEESLGYQTATSDVLKVISRSTFDLHPVLDTLVNTAGRLCSADFGHLTLRDGEVYRVAASFSFSEEWDAFLRRQTFSPGRGSVVSRSLLEASAVHVADITVDPEYAVPEAITLEKFAPFSECHCYAKASQ